MKKVLFAIAMLMLFASPSYAAECFTEDMVTKQETRDGSIAMPLNTVETASLIEGLKAKYPTGKWDRDLDTSVAYVLEKNNIVRIVYFKDKCARTMTDLPLDAFLTIITGTAAKPAPSKSKYGEKPEGGWEL